VIERNMETGITKVAEPMGVIAGIIPTTNPTSTAIFKSLLALKTRNAIILSPHPRAVKSTIEAARIVYEAARAAGAPEDVVSWIEKPTMEMSSQLMRDPNVSLILATGGNAMVKSAMSSAHAALGVGAGNTPVIVDETADIQTAVNSILLSKSFDNGVICASEQSIVVVEDSYDAVKKEFEKRGAYFLKEGSGELDKVRGALVVNGRINPEIVGKSAMEIGHMVGLDATVHEGNRVLIGEVNEIGDSEPLSSEKLCPVLAMYKARSFEHATELAEALLEYGGKGHTSVLYTNPLNYTRIQHFQEHMQTVRILINTPASQGAIGDLYNFHLDPSLTLGCGTWADNAVSSNVNPSHLLNYKTVTERRENMLWFRVPPKIFMKPGCLELALTELSHKKRAFIVTDKPLYDMGVSKKVTDVLDSMGVIHQTFYHIAPDPTLSTIEEGRDVLAIFKPDVIIAIGGGSPMDAAKIMWLLYEHPDMSFDSVAARFMDIRKRVYQLPELGKKTDLVCIPTTSGTGSEVTPFSVVTDDKTGNKYPLADYALTPSMAIIDPQLVLHMPKTLTAYGGIDALTHAIESYVSVCATDFTRGLSREAIRLLFKYLPRAYAKGANDPEAREHVHYAATIAGMAFANGFLGICHSMAHKLGGAFHVPHGLANAALITHVIAYNATDAPFKQAIFPQYKYPVSKERYLEIARGIGICDSIVSETSNEDERICQLLEAIEALKESVGIPNQLRKIMGEEKKDEYFSKIDGIAEQAFDDQCTGANPRYPLVKDLRRILESAW
jgi:acetaldehyde dehydrogenase / alcohol dehydrogenase